MESDTFTIKGGKCFYPFSVDTLDFFFQYIYDFKLDMEYNNDGNDLSPFINDAINYRQYITDILTDSETEIGIW